MKITFNTKRLYTNEGQIITATYDKETCEVQFNDHSRMVSGKFEYSAGDALVRWERDPSIFARIVMGRYDLHQYQMLGIWEAPERGEEVYVIQL